MRKSIMSLYILGSATITMLAIPAVSQDKSPELNPKQQALLDKALSGRSAGSATNCINRIDQKKMTVISDDILIFQSSRNSETIYVNKPGGGCSRVKKNSLVYQRPGTPLCRGDIAQVVDFLSGTSVASCAFSEFTPYTRIDK